MMGSRLTAAAMAALLLSSAAVFAQNTPPAVAADVMIPAPAEPGAIVLPAPAGAVSKNEQWFTGGSKFRAVRNVAVATLMPFLPEPGKATGAAVIVAPGGGFTRLEMDAEGYEVARRLADQGIAAFVLKYRLHAVPANSGLIENAVPRGATTKTMPGGNGQPDLTPPAPAVADAQAAMRTVRSRAAEWQIDPKRVGMMGFSAGAILTLALGLQDEASTRPAFILPIYGLFAKRPVPDYAPPMFAAIALDDPITAWTPDLDLFESWRAANRPVEAHFYETGGHGFASTAKGATSDLWFGQAMAWMKARGLLRAPGAPSMVYTSSLPLGTLLDDPDAKAILAKHLPALVSGGTINQVRGLSLKSLNRYSPTVVTDQALAAIDHDLAALSAR